MYEPKIIGFLCNWCSYRGADTAGMARLKYPPNVKIIRVPCSGRISPELVLRTFRKALTESWYWAAILAIATTAAETTGQPSGCPF